ncbi:MAG: hypothetical protein VB078_05420 [Clostridiaceae bacterium]|nr:hypothetical protein [Clostridiaceae bacterium]
MKSKKIRAAINESIDSPIPVNIYPAIDTDLARDNIENDLSDADLQDFHPRRKGIR